MYPPTSDHGAKPPYYQPAATGFPVSYSNYNPPVPHPQPPPPPPLQPQAQVDWSTGLCDCCSNCGNCCLTCWCPCVTFGRLAEVVDKGSTSCGASGALYSLVCCVLGCGWLYSCFYRSRMRRQYMLKEKPCCDCLVHCCCEPCALCQEYRELENRGFDMVIGWHGNVEQRSRGVAMAPTAPTVEHMSR